jgi:hypothetical protein
VAEAIAELTDKGCTQPLLFRIASDSGCDQFWIKLDHQATQLFGVSCFSDCVEFLFQVFFVYNIEYPYVLRLVYGLFEKLLGLKPSVGKSTTLNEVFDAVRK